MEWSVDEAQDISGQKRLGIRIVRYKMENQLYDGSTDQKSAKRNWFVIVFWVAEELNEVSNPFNNAKDWSCLL